jgi:hypothetical protein
MQNANNIPPEPVGGRMTGPEKIRLGELLLQKSRVTVDRLKAALDEQKKNNRWLGHVLIGKDVASEKKISEALAS